MNTQLKIILYIVFVVGIFYFLQQKFSIFDISFDEGIKKSSIEEMEEGKNSVLIQNSDSREILVEIEVADTNALRSLGLSGRKELGDYQGMLFIMPEYALHTFWMKDMYIPLDILYIDMDGKVVDIFDMQQPCTNTNCPGITSPYLSKYILEVNGGFCELNRVEVGNTLTFNISSEE